MAKQRVIVGDPFDGTSVDTKPTPPPAEQSAAKPNVHKDRTRSRIAYGTGLLGSMFMVAAAVYGLYDGSFDELSNVWVAFGPISGAIVGYYFGQNGTENGDG